MVYYSPYDGSLYYYDYRGSRFAGACTAGWVEADLGFDPAEGVGTAWVDYTFRWTGDGYLMCQSVTGRGMMGTGADRFSPNNNKVIFLDRSFHRTGEHDFGAPVENVACVDGVCYALMDGTVWQSADREQWTATSLDRPAGGGPPDRSGMAHQGLPGGRPDRRFAGLPGGGWEAAGLRRRGVFHGPVSLELHGGGTPFRGRHGGNWCGDG